MTRVQHLESGKVRHPESPRDRFIRLFPVGTVVFREKGSPQYGTTINRRIYIDPTDQYVEVINVDGLNLGGFWLASQVVKKRKR